MKFVSKNMNLRIVLRHGIPAEPLSGRNAIPGLYVKFENGLADVNDNDTVERMLKHPGFNSDFISIEDNGKDPYADYRSEKEPDHIVTEMQYGHIGKTVGKKVSLTPEQKKALRPMAEAMAKEMLKEMAPSFMKEMLKTLSATKQEENGVAVKSEKKNNVTEDIDENVNEINDVEDESEDIDESDKEEENNEKEGEKAKRRKKTDKSKNN